MIIPHAQRLLRDDRAQFVAINLLVNLLFLLRSYLFMLVLDYRDLGLVALLQSIVLLLGMLQFGMLNGGYRLLLSEQGEGRQRIVDLVYSFIAMLIAVCLVLAGLALVATQQPYDALIGLLGVVGGGASLLRNWQTNLMIAAGRLKLLNTINFLTAIFSLLPLLFIGSAALEACIAAIVLQPVMFTLAAWLLGNADRPDRFLFPGDLVRRALGAGFLPFLAAMLLQVNVQVERWYVTAALGVEALGHLFVAIMFVTVLQLVPTAINAVFLPTAVEAHTAGDDSRLRTIMRQYFALLGGYALLAALAVAVLARPVLTLLAPKYLPDLAYVYLISPGALLLCVSGAFTLSFVVLIRYKVMISAYSIGTGLLIAVVAHAVATQNTLSLEGVTIARSVGLGVTALGTVIAWWLLAREYPGIRFLTRERDD
ncbi:lipopolysaccharide biosynthesis protein [Alteriqipengyuania sp. 357]